MRRKESEDPRSGKSWINFNASGAFKGLSQIYKTALDALEEAIQNAIDSGAPKVVVVVNVKQREIKVEDNGVGFGWKAFDDHLLKIASSDKSQDPGVNLGEKGLGLLAFIGKAADYRFTSAPAECKGQPGWEGYVVHHLGHMGEEEGRFFIPSEEMRELTESPPWWNTQVSVSGFPPKYQLRIALDALIKDITYKFSIAMLERKTNLEIHYVDGRGKKSPIQRVTPSKFEGAALKVKTFQGKDCGKVVLELFKCDEPGGTIFLRTSQSTFRLTLSSLRQQAEDIGINMQAFEDLTSGWLEGLITIDKAEVTPDRQSLEADIKTADLLAILEKWWQEEGIKLVPSDREGKQEAREKNALLNAVTYFNKLAACQEESYSLGQIISIISPGAAVPEGHVDGETHQTPPSRSEDKKPPSKVGGTRGPNQGSTGTSTGSKGGIRIEAITDKNFPRRFTAKEKGLRIAFEKMPGSELRFSYDLEEGIFNINNRHPDFLSLAENVGAIERYVIFSVIYALSTQMVDERIRNYLPMLEEPLFALHLPAIKGTLK